MKPAPDLAPQSHFWRTPSLNVLCTFAVTSVRGQAKMSSRFHGITRAAAMSAMLALSSQAFAQSDDVDPEMRIQQLENQLRQLTGQNEELQYRNRQLEERLRLLQGGAQAAPSGQPTVPQPSMAAAPSMQPNPAYRQPQ